MRRFVLAALVVSAVTTALLPGIAFSHAPTGASASINAGATYTNSVNVTVTVTALHCNSGGNWQSFDVAAKNPTDTVYTAVSTTGFPAGGTPCPSTAQSGSFSWTLVAGDGLKTVDVRLGGGSHEVFVSDSITLDTVAPTITQSGFTGTANGADWYNAAVSVQFTATDSLSGVACTPNPWNVSSGTSEGSAVTVPSGACADNAGNNNTGINAGPYKIDLTAPAVSITSPLDGSSTGAVSVDVVLSASDGTSGVASVKATLGGTDYPASFNGGTGVWTATAVPLVCGANTIGGSATDNASNTGVATAITVTRTCSNTGKAAPAIANAYIKATAGLADACRAAHGGAKNWHGRVISAIAHEYGGQDGYTEAAVRASVDALCD